MGCAGMNWRLDVTNIEAKRWSRILSQFYRLPTLTISLIKRSISLLPSKWLLFLRNGITAVYISIKILRHIGAKNNKVYVRYFSAC
jgi:hypothetical protein